mmetsp:Transcript_853/g.2597  ORF Transcript_853/g.2597 Transcript_853/m.2597 type:complete len:117 (+) Transcript_853:1146-1496(+)
MATLELRAHAHLARGDVAGALPLFRELAIRRREIYAPLPHARVALDNVTLAECASVAGDQLLANAARKEAIRLLERTGAPDARQLDDMRIQHAMADNARSDDKLAANFDHLGLDGE